MYPKYTNTLKLNNKKTTQLKNGKYLNKNLPKEDIQMSNSICKDVQHHLSLGNCKLKQWGITAHLLEWLNPHHHHQKKKTWQCYLLTRMQSNAYSQERKQKTLKNKFIQTFLRHMFSKHLLYSSRRGKIAIQANKRIDLNLNSRLSDFRNCAFT